MRILALVLALFATPVFAERQPVDRGQLNLRRILRSGNGSSLAVETDRTLDTMIKLAVWRLRIAGYDVVADDMQHQWLTRWKGDLLREDIGDHRPLSIWLSDQYLKLAILVGTDVLHALRLDDLEVVNLALPVVFHLSQITEPITELDYSQHFIPLSSALSYWSTWATCTGITWGMGAISMACGFVAGGVSHVIEVLVAPRYSDRFYAYFY